MVRGMKWLRSWSFSWWGFVAVTALFTPWRVGAAEGFMPAASAAAAVQAAPAAWHFLHVGELDPKKILPPPPAPGSLAAQADLETVLHVQAARTPEQVAWAKFIEHDDLFKNARVLGDWFSAENLPFTAEFFHQIDDDGGLIFGDVKTLYPRQRPPFADARVQPCVELKTTGSYPSGHSSQAWMWAGLLAEIFPEKRTELLDRARDVAWGRVIGGVHYPTDTIGGKLLGDAIVAELLKLPAVQEAIRHCRAEAEPFLRKKAA
jgi:acid phosphatase (class A)